MNDRQHVLVLGASGYVGSHLVPRLIERGFRVRASARDAEVLAARGWGCEVVAADALRPETLAAALDGIEVAYWREGAAEVDFVLHAGGRITAIEVKSALSSPPAGLRAFQRQFPKARTLLVGPGSGGALALFLSPPPADGRH